MIQCPNCRATLPDGAGHCQFCQTAFTPPAGANPASGETETESAIAPQPKWVWAAYYGVAVWWIVSGLYGILASTVLASSRSGSAVGAIGLVIEVVTALVGVGLLLKVELARGIVNVLCFLQILSGALGLLFDFFSPALHGLWGIVSVLVDVVSVALAMLMIYLIGETETRSPDF